MPEVEEHDVHVMGIGGSLSPTSTSLAALKAALAAAKKEGATTSVFDIRSNPLPMFVPGMDPPPEVVSFADAVNRADALIWSSPLYHGSISGSFKNAIDWLDVMKKYDPPYLDEKVVGLITTAGGVQGMQGINSMEFIVRALRGYAVPFVVPIARAYDVFTDDGRLTDEKMEAQLEMFAQQVVHAARHFVPA